MSTPPGKWVISLLSQHHRTSVPVTLTSLTNGPGMPEWWYQASLFLEFCVAVFAVTSSVLHHLQGKKYLPPALLGSEAFSDLLWTHALAPSCDGIRKLVSLSLAFSAPGWGLTAFCLFSQRWCYSPSLWSHVPAELGLLFMCTHKVSSKAPCCLSECSFRLCHLWQPVQGAGHRVGVSVGEAQRWCSCPWANGVIHRWGFPSGSLVDFWVESTKQLIGFLSVYCPPRVLCATFPVSSHAPVMEISS